jgi:cell volume regulation protein A
MDLLRLIQELPIEHLLLGISTLLLLSVFSSQLSGKLGVPALVLFLIIGMLAGSEGPGGIEFDYPRLAQSLGVIALTLILFSGGLDTHWHQIRPVVLKGFALATVGVCLTAGLVAWLSIWLLDFALLDGLLLGAIVSSTDAAAVFMILRSRQIRLRGQLAPLLELESGSNDPMAVFLTVGLITLLTQPGATPLDIVPMFFHQMILGALIGYSMGACMTALCRHLRLEYEGLHAVLSLGVALFTYGVTASVGGNGFLAVYLAGLTVGNSAIKQLDYLRRFHEGQAWLMQIMMFLTLGLQVFPSQVVPVIGPGLILSLFLMFAARPAAVLATLVFSELNLKEKLFVSWGGLRGAVPIVLATFPLIAGLHQAQIIFNLVFFIVLTSVLLQGTSLISVSRWLGLTGPEIRSVRATGDW